MAWAGRDDRHTAALRTRTRGQAGARPALHAGNPGLPCRAHLALVEQGAAELHVVALLVLEVRQRRVEAAVGGRRAGHQGQGQAGSMSLAARRAPCSLPACRASAAHAARGQPPSPPSPPLHTASPPPWHSRGHQICVQLRKVCLGQRLVKDLVDEAAEGHCQLALIHHLHNLRQGGVWGVRRGRFGGEGELRI